MSNHPDQSTGIPSSTSSSPVFRFGVFVLVVLAGIMLFNRLSFGFGFGLSSSQSEEETITLPVASLSEVAVQTTNGAVALTGSSSSDQIEIHVTKKARANSKGSAKEALKAIRIDTPIAGSTQKIGWSWAVPKKLGWQATVSFEISAPSRLAVSTSSHNGEIKLSSFQAPANLESSNGAIIVADLNGNLTAETSNGEINVRNHVGKLKAETSNGAIKARSETDDVQLVTHNGAIEADFSGGKLNGNIETSNGSIDLRFSDKTSTKIDCKTSQGAIIRKRALEDPVVGGRSVTGTLGGGDGKLLVRSSNGAITID